MAKAGNYQPQYGTQDQRFRSPQYGVDRALSTIMHQPKEAEAESSVKYKRRSARLKSNRVRRHPNPFAMRALRTHAGKAELMLPIPTTVFENTGEIERIATNPVRRQFKEAATMETNPMARPTMQAMMTMPTATTRTTKTTQRRMKRP